MTSTLNDGTHPGTLMSGALYSPLGGLASDSLGNGTTESFYYDKRDRLGCQTIAKSGTPLYTLALANANGQCPSFSGNGYSGNGDVLSSQDSVNGNWTYQYDDFNRVVTANASSGPMNGTAMTWTYDRFGNRWSQTGASPLSQTYTGHNNRIDGATYDPAGNMTISSGNQYLYDDENCIVMASLALGGSAAYAYDAEGRRVRKAVGSTLDEYVFDAAGRQIADLQPGGWVRRADIYAGARHLATYDAATNSTYFIHADILGTERLRANVTGSIYETCTNLPFGDDQVCAGGADINPMHFTGKERDSESGNDYFGARYYASSMGRFLSPDWSAKEEPVPYAVLTDPQSLNLYSYVRNNPLGRRDGNGHCCDDCAGCDSMAGTPLEGSTKHPIQFITGVITGLINRMPVGDCSMCGPKGPLNPPQTQMEAQGQQAAPLILAAATFTVSVVAAAPAMLETQSATVSAEIPQVAMTPFPTGAQPGQVLEGIDPNTLQAGRPALDASRLATQQGLIDSGTPRATPIQVTTDGVIYDGNHGAAAAANSGVPVNVQVVNPPVAPTPQGPPASLPVHQ